MASSDEAEEEILAMKLAHVRHFDETSADFARSLLTDCNNADKSIEVARQSACAQYLLLSSLQDKTAEAASKVADIRKELGGQCNSTDSKDLSLEYLAASLSNSGEELFASQLAASLSNNGEELFASNNGEELSASSSKSVHAEETKIEPLDVTLVRMRSAVNVLKAFDNEIEDFMCARKSAAEAEKADSTFDVLLDEQADSTFDMLLDFWLRLYINLSRNNDDKSNPNDLALNVESSSLDNARIRLLVYEDRLDKQIATQKQTIQRCRQQHQKLEEDIETVQEVVAALMAQNLQLNDQIKANHVKGRNSICQTLSSEKSKIQRVSGCLQSKGAKARASLVSAELASFAEEGASPKQVIGKSEYGDAVLQECLKSLRDAFAGGDAANALERQTMRTQNALQFLKEAARSIREENLVEGSKETLRAYERLMKNQDKVFLLLDGTVDGRTFADWLPDLIPLVKENLERVEQENLERLEQS